MIDVAAEPLISLSEVAEIELFILKRMKEFTLGDHAYPNGSAKQIQECYEPSWGRHNASRFRCSMRSRMRLRRTKRCISAAAT